MTEDKEIKYIALLQKYEDLEQEQDSLNADIKQLTQWLDESRQNADVWCNKCNELKQEKELFRQAHKAEQDRRRAYENALEEIRGLASQHCIQCLQILDIVNEVLQ